MYIHLTLYVYICLINQVEQCLFNINLCVYLCIYIYIHVYIYMYISFIYV